MLDLILFSSIGLLLLVLLGFLVIVIRDHMKSKSFELYVHQTQEQFNRDYQSLQERGKPENVAETETKPQTTASSYEPVNTVDTQPVIEERAPEPIQEEVRETSQAEEKPQIEEKSQLEKPMDVTLERPTIYKLHPETQNETPASREEAGTILKKDYGEFSHQRLVEGMGLSPEEADEFVVELIHQLENAINDLDNAIAEKNFTEAEHITHGLKGAALNIGEGGVAQLLVDYNTYMKEGTELPVIEAYQTLLKQTVSDLKVEYSQVA